MANHKITIYHDGTILTMDADSPQVEALAVMDGRIVATGSLKDVKQAVGDGADLVSLEGGTLLPGFIDGHSHFCSGGMNRLYAADCAVENMEALKESLRRKLHDDRPSQWVVGHSFDEKGMEEQCYPTREILDEVSTDVPIFFRHVTGHTGIANSKALEIAGITRDTPDPAGGIIGRDAQGEPNGILEGIPAQTLVRKHIPGFTLDEMRAALADDSARYASCGITTAQGGPAFSPMDAELGHKVTELVLDCAHDGTLTIRTVLFIRANDMSRLAPYPNHVPGTDLSGNGRVTMGAAKLWADGDPRGHTDSWRNNRGDKSGITRDEPGHTGKTLCNFIAWDENRRGGKSLPFSSLLDGVRVWPESLFRLSTHHGSGSVGGVLPHLGKPTVGPLAVVFFHR